MVWNEIKVDGNGMTYMVDYAKELEAGLSVGNSYIWNVIDYWYSYPDNYPS